MRAIRSWTCEEPLISSRKLLQQAPDIWCELNNTHTTGVEGITSFTGTANNDTYNSPAWLGMQEASLLRGFFVGQGAKPEL